MALDHEAQLAAARKVAGDQRRKVLGRLVGRKAVLRAYRRLFLIDQGGALKPDALVVLGDLAELAELGRASPFAAASDAALREREGARRVVLTLISNLDLSGERLAKLNRKIEEHDE